MGGMRFKYGMDPRILGLKDPQAKRAHDLVTKALESIGMANSQDGKYALKILGTKARNAVAKQPKLERRKRERRIARAAGGEAKSKSDWLKEADKWFSRYIRLRDTQPDGEGGRWGMCVTCGHVFDFSQLQCGHFVRREHHATRFNEKNCHSQASCCNLYKGGAEDAHKAYINHTYGRGAAEELIQLARIHKRKKTMWELKAIVAEFKAKAKEIGSDDVEGWRE